MREIARSIIVRGDKLLLLKRNKDGKEYYILPGGGIDEGETAEQAAERETREEASIESQTVRKVYKEEPTEFGITSYFLSDYLSGEPMLDPDSIEAEIMKKKGDNIWEPMWLDIEKLSETRLLPTQIHAQLIHDLDFGFADETRIIKTQMEKL